MSAGFRTYDSVVTSPVLRPTARVLLTDAADRVLLMHARPADGEMFWFPPGGGIEAGESPHEAAVRELVEETGWVEPAVGPVIGHRRVVVTWSDGVTYDCRETWFWARVEALDVDDAGWTEDERRDMDGFRWWTLPELHATDERLAPADLADRVARLLRDGPPTPPWELGS